MPPVTPPDPAAPSSGPTLASPPGPADPIPPDPPALRRLALAIAVLHDTDLDPYADGIVLRGGRPVEVTWRELRHAVADAPLEGTLARRRALRYLQARRAVADASDVADLLRPLGFAVDAADHPGLEWVQERVLGGALDLGIGVVTPADDVVALPVVCFRNAGIDPAQWWPQLRGHLERMGTIATERLRRDRDGVLRPMGGCDVVTLLGSAILRRALADEDGTGMRAVVVPTRSRGWVDPRRLDPAYALAAAAVSDELERGFPRPILVTADEVALAGEGARPAEIDLRDPAPQRPSSHGFRWP